MGSRGPHEPANAVNPGRRFTPSESQESMYTTLARLTIKNVRRSDLGNYTCNARNSLGSVRETVALKELIISTPRPTTKEVFGSQGSNRIPLNEGGGGGLLDSRNLYTNSPISPPMDGATRIPIVYKDHRDEEFSLLDSWIEEELTPDEKDGLEPLEDFGGGNTYTAHGGPDGDDGSNIQNNIFIRNSGRVGAVTDALIALHIVSLMHLIAVI